MNNGIWKDFVHLIHKQTNYRQICLFYISWLNYMLSKMLLPVISKSYMIGITHPRPQGQTKEDPGDKVGYHHGITRLCHSVCLFCDNKYQKFLTGVFFLIHISTCFCCFPFNILGEEFMTLKKEFEKT